MITDNNVAFKAFNNRGFKLILGEAAAKLEVSLDRHSVAQQLYGLFLERIESLKKDLVGKLLYLKFDGVTRHHRHFISIVVQFFGDKKIEVIYSSQIISSYLDAFYVICLSAGRFPNIW
jgi:hypothetical protein